MLLIEGKPGSGKSTLTKYFKDNLFEKEPLARQAIVASFFYSHREEGELHTNHSNMLRSILHDVLQQNETFFIYFQSLYRKMLLCGVWPYDSLKEILLSFKEHTVKERLYLFLDAMDESDGNHRDDIVQLMHQLCATNKLCIFKVILASRPIAWPSRHLTQFQNIIKLQDENSWDILNFVQSFLAPLNLNFECRGKIIHYIVRNAQGVFLWVHLVKKELIKYDATACTNKEIYDFLESLPTELDEFYELNLSRLEKNEQRDVKVGVRLIQLVLFAYRPLSIHEIRQALAIPDDIDAEYSPSDVSYENELINDIVKRIIHCGGNFLDIKGPRESSNNPNIMVLLTYI